jgi:hypothetical protein
VQEQVKVQVEDVLVEVAAAPRVEQQPAELRVVEGSAELVEQLQPVQFRHHRVGLTSTNRESPGSRYCRFQRALTQL